MQKLQDSVFSMVKTTNLSPAVFNYLQPSEDFAEQTPLGGILSDSKLGWLALGPKLCVVDLRTGLKVAARTFGSGQSNSRTSVTNVVELPTPLTNNSQQLLVSLEYEGVSGMICVFHINGSQVLRSIQTEFIVTKLAVCNGVPDGWFTCFDGVVMAGTKCGEIFAFDLNRACLIQALKDISQGYEHLIQNEANPANIAFLSLKNIAQIEEQRDLALEEDNHIGILINESSLLDNQYIFHNPDGSVRMKAKSAHVRVTVVQYVPQLGSLAVGFNFGAFQIWNLMTLDLEYTSQVNAECLPVTHFGFQEPCDDPRAFCYLWVIFSLADKFEDEGFPLAVMYSLTYQGKRMLSDTKYLYQEFSSAALRFQLDLNTMGETGLFGGRCVSCHTYSMNSTLGEEGEDSMLNICHLVWECWGESRSSVQYGMLLFDLDQWYKDQMPSTYQIQSNVFMSASWCGPTARGTLDARLLPALPYCHATRLEEHLYPNSLQYSCICLNTSEICTLNTIGIQRQIISSMEDIGPTVLLNPTRLYNACVSAGLTPLYLDTYTRNTNQEEQRKFLLSVALEARLSRFLKRCAHDWATGSHTGVGCTLTFLVDWAWDRALELKENAKELTTPLFVSSSLPDRNVVRCLEHCVQQLTQLTGLLDAILTKCCNLVVPDALSEMEEKFSGIGTVSLYLQVVQWFLRVGLLPEKNSAHADMLPYPRLDTYTKRRMKLHRLVDNGPVGEEAAHTPCPLLYIDQLIEHEFGGERIYEMWLCNGSEWNGLYPPPSLHALLRLYLLPDIPEEHKHSLVLYLLVDYSMLYDDVRYESIIRRLMQFPTMFGLSNTAIKATQAFWHLDHRDFDFALDQLQCLTGNTLSEWQHNVVLSSLLAQKKTQAALQYLHVRKPAPIYNMGKGELNISNRGDQEKLVDWRSCCALYLARHLVFDALEIVRTCVHNAHTDKDKEQVLNFFFKGCRNTGQLAKILQVTLLPFEEEAFIKYLENCNESQTSDILIMYYLQQARYLEAEQYNKKLKQKPRKKDMSMSVESLADSLDRETARDALVEVMTASLPKIANTIASFALSDKHIEPRVLAPKPMSVFVQANSPKNTFTYKSSFIQDTIENASETWINKPKLKRGLKRALNVEDTPFICTPKISRIKSAFPEESTPPKRAKLDLNATPITPKRGTFKVSEKLSHQMSILLDMPNYQSPDMKLYNRSGADTPQSILKTRRTEEQEPPSPADSRYLGDSDEELETASHFSDSTNKHLRFTIPTASESGSTPSPPVAAPAPCQSHVRERQRSVTASEETGMDESFVTTLSHQPEPHPLESPPKKLAVPGPEEARARKSYKDSVRGRRSLSISANSSLSDDPNTSIESIADIPITLINPRYSGGKRSERQIQIDAEKEEDSVIHLTDTSEAPKTPKGRKAIREKTPLNRSRSATPEHFDSPTVTPSRTSRMTRSRSRTPELSPRSPVLAPILEQPMQEVEIEPHQKVITLSAPRQLRSRSRTPERVIDKNVKDSSRLEAITESPTKPTNVEMSTSPRRGQRSRSRTPEVEVPVEQPVEFSPRRLRGRSKTPEKMSPKVEYSAKAKKPLSRLVLEANTFAKSKKNLEKTETESSDVEESTNIECTPLKSSKLTFMDMTLSPIVNQSVLQNEESNLSSSIDKDNKCPDDSVDNLNMKSLPTITSMNETYFQKSVLLSYESSDAEITESIQETKEIVEETISKIKPLPEFKPLHESDLETSVLRSYQSSIAESSDDKSQYVDMRNHLVEMSSVDNSVLKDVSSLITNDSDVEMREDKDSGDTANVIQKEKEKIVEIEREINEIEEDMSDNEGEHMEDDDNSSGDEEILEAEPSGSDQSDEECSDEESSDDEDSSKSDDDEIISIKDTDSENSTSSEDKLKIDESEYEPQQEERRPGSAENNIIIGMDKHEEIENNKPEPSIINEGSNDSLNQAHLSLLTDDNSMISDKSEVNLNYSDESKYKVDALTIEESSAEKDIEPVVEIEVMVEEIAPPDIEDAKKSVSLDEPDTPQEKMHTEVVPSTVHEIKDDNADKEELVATIIETKNVEETVSEETMEVDNVQTEQAVIEKQELLEKQEKVIEKSDKKQEKETEIEKEQLIEEKLEAETDKQVPTRKRTNSTSSNKSGKDTQEEEPKTPLTRKRSQSQTSTKSETEKTPESVKSVETTPSRRKARTPSTEVRKIMTRRASKEISEKDDTKEEIPSTPRRSTRSRNKNIDDNASVVSEGSIKSSASKNSEDLGEIKAAPIRKGRRSVLSTKPDLSVIPENAIEDVSKDEGAMGDYSTSRRLTRNQKAMLTSLSEPRASPRRRASTASRTSIVSDQSVDDDITIHSELDGQTSYRISSINKDEFQGSPDRDELTRSPISLHSDSTTRPRLERAASESKSTPKAKSIRRRTSVDVAPMTPERGAAGDSPARSRRASFNRAVEALHTPKGRRASTDLRKGETESAQGSPAGSEVDTPTTPARRPRRASTQSNITNTKSKLPTVEEK